MVRAFGAFSVDRVMPLFDGLYYDFIIEAFDQARQRIWGSVFIVNVLQSADVDRKVRRLLQLLAAKRVTGVDVRLVVGRSLTAEIQLSNAVSISYGTTLGIPIRAHGARRKPLRVQSPQSGPTPVAVASVGSSVVGRGDDKAALPRRSQRSMHNKYVVVDDALCVIGSHNWTNSAFSHSVEDSAAVYSRGLNHELAAQFLVNWVR